MNVHAATNDFSPLIEEAERAAAGGDYVGAERLLRDVASQQEASLGSLHPDLANTLNNLAVVYETIDDPANAERCYRRAYAIAIAALDPDHPFVATSEKNYRDFCAARGVPVEPVTPAPAVAVADALAPPPGPLGVRASDQPSERLADVTEEPPIAARHASRSRAIVLLGGVGFASLVAAGLWFGIDSNVELPQGVTSAAPRQTIISTRQSTSVAAGRPARKAANTTGGRVETAGRVEPTFDAVNLCSDLSRPDWRCKPAGRPVDSGPLFFYTRIKTPSDLTVEHRWYRDDRLHRVVALRVQSNQLNGFRTYSRTAVDPGDWRVEVRTRDGALLHSERFVVR
jgi:hypothetical protein